MLVWLSIASQSSTTRALLLRGQCSSTGMTTAAGAAAVTAAAGGAAVTVAAAGLDALDVLAFAFATDGPPRGPNGRACRTCDGSLPPRDCGSRFGQVASARTSSEVGRDLRPEATKPDGATRTGRGQRRLYAQLSGRPSR